MTDLLELVKTMRLVGLRRMLRLRRAQRLAWGGLLNGFYGTRALQTLFNVGLLDAMQEQGSIDVRRFAETKELDPHLLRSLCDAMFALGLFEKETDGYWLTADGRLLAEVGRGWFDAVYGYEGVVHSLEPLLRKKAAYGRDIWRRPDFVARGSGAAEAWLYFPLAVDYIVRHGHRKALDLGCGEGTFLRYLCARHPQIKGCGIDLAAEAIAEGHTKLDSYNLGQRVGLMTGDMTKLDAAPDVARDADVATTFFVLHELLAAGADVVIGFLTSFRRLFPGVPLLVFELDRPTPEDMRKRPGMAVAYYLQHDLSQQKPVAKEAWLPMFELAGFAHIEQRNLSFARSVMFTLQ
ncbi:MAG: methyltransferase domain-containing protein [Luteitalea sp.]|nr:methyltransferase domain-containing protein [Luteitalea sp.]